MLIHLDKQYWHTAILMVVVYTSNHKTSNIYNNMDTFGFTINPYSFYNSSDDHNINSNQKKEIE